MNTQTAIHITDNYLINPVNPITVNLIGAGGTGSQFLTALARMNHSLIALGHAGLQLNLYDDDLVTEANLGRQLFAGAELGMYKSVALINRINRFFGTNWKAVTRKFEYGSTGGLPEKGLANLYISCVDTVAARFGIAGILAGLDYHQYTRSKPYYWMDMGNARYTGQVILSTIGAIKQPESKLYRTVSVLPMITDEFKELLEVETENHEPSCSLAEALDKQDLYINSAVANFGASLLWQLFREGMVENRGAFINLKEFRTVPLKVA
jgi:PRTRC genetic system ThiF family protein